MPQIRMLVDMQGGRYDGREWPGYKGLIDVPQWEADMLIGGRNAEYPENPDLNRGWDVMKIQDTVDYESKLKLADGSDREEEEEEIDFEEREPLSDDWDEDDFDRDPEPEDVTPEVKRPYTSANKAEWIDYVVEKGFTTRSDAKSMTKAQLIALSDGE